MKPSTVEKLIWIAMYGGLLSVALGLSVRTSDAALGIGIVVGGGLAAVVGVVLIYVRSRMRAQT